MSARRNVTFSQICEYFHVEMETVTAFAEIGLIPAIPFEGERSIEPEGLDSLVKILELHRTLGINKEGIEVILELRRRVTTLQEENEDLKNVISGLKFYESLQGHEVLARRGLLIEVDLP